MNIFLTRQRNSKFKTSVLSRLRFIFFCTVLFCETLPAQICDKKTAIYFETDQFSIPAAENQKLVKLTSMFAQKTDTFLLEIDAFTDSVASVAYNYKLANNRLKTIVTYLKKNASSHFEIKERVRGEALPLGSNATEEGRSKNRRVDIFYWKLKGGRITIKGKGGMEIDIQKDYFGPCGICESNPKMTEAFTNEEAARQGISLATTDGNSLITGGMMNLELNCDARTKREGNNNWPCTDVIIRIPAASYNEDMDVWKSTRENDQRNVRWYIDRKGQLEYDAKNKCYLMKVNYCPGTGINCDKIDDSYNHGVRYSKALIALPELTRAKKTIYMNAAEPGNFIYGGKKLTDIIWQFGYSSKGSAFLADSGVGKNKIGYVFSGVIDRYEAKCDTACSKHNQCWCFEIPIDAYTKIIYFQKNKKYRLKMPRKYRNNTPRLFIPAADSLLPLTRLKGSSRKYIFQQPLPDTYVVVYSKNNNPDNKRAYDAQIDLSQVRKKYSKRHKYYKIKIKRKQLKKVISANS